MVRRPRLDRGAQRALVVLLLAVGLAGAGLSGGLAPAAADTTPPSTVAGAPCPAANPPNTLTLVSGTPQTAQLGAAFANGLQVTLANTNGCPVTTAVAGVPITFTAPVSGASGTFSASGSNSVTVGSDASGLVSAAMFSANDTAGSYAIGASSSYGLVSFSLTNTATGMPATITAISPKKESASVATRYRQPLQVRVLDANGIPVQGASVTFALGTGTGGSGGGGSSGAGAGGSDAASAGASFGDGTTQATETTNSSGLARSPRFTANTVAGTFRATATIAAGGASVATLDPASFSLDNLAGKPPAVRLLGNAHRSAPVGMHYRAPLRVKVLGANGKPLQGATVTFTLGASSGGSSVSGAGSSSAGASFSGGTSQATATTAASGIATSPRFEANTTPGRFVATVALAGSTRAVGFLLRNVAGTPRTLTAGAAATESTSAGARFPIRLAVTVADVDANPVAGVFVTFSAPERGPSGSFGRSRTIRVRTNAAGIAVAPAFTANSEPGGYVVEATLAHANPAAFALVNQPRGQPS
jgi:protocatechuate 3,4-dioxygenase beta subunit